MKNCLMPILKKKIYVLTNFVTNCKQKNKSKERSVEVKTTFFELIKNICYLIRKQVVKTDKNVL